MSYKVGADGEVEYTCKACAKTATTKRLASLPKGWCVTGILAVKPDPEFEDHEELERARAESGERLREIGGMLGAHFCSVREGQKYLRQEGVMEHILKAGVTLALWGKCDVVIDGAGLGANAPVDGYRKGELPPPATYKEGASPI